MPIVFTYSTVKTKSGKDCCVMMTYKKLLDYKIHEVGKLYNLVVNVT